MPRKELTSKVKGLIIDMTQQGVTVREIARRLKVGKSTVSYITKKYEVYGDTTNRSRSGRPKATTGADDRAIVRMVKKNPKITATEVNQVLKASHVNVTDQTVRNRLYAAGLKGCRARCKPLISQKNKKARLEFAKNYVDKPLSYWEKVLWTDETKLNMFQSDGKCTVWRESGKASAPKNTTASVKHGGGSVMAWACFSAQGTGDLVFIDDLTEDGSHIMDGDIYRKILDTYIQSNARKLIGRGFVMQSDNDPKHTARATQELIKKKKWKTLEWPSQSPDLNPIEHMFNLLKTKMRKENPRNKAELKEKILQAWKSINVSTTTKLVHSMPRRLQAVIENKGYATKY